MKRRNRSEEKDDKVEVFGGDPVERDQLRELCFELGRTVNEAGTLLSQVEKDYSLIGNFIFIAEKLVKLKGDSRQMGLTKVGDLAEIAEELAIKGSTASQRPHIRRVVGALWDAVTTLHYILDQVSNDTTVESEYLTQRLVHALDSLGGPRSKVDQDAISRLLRSN
jgi:hypothetical protein